MSRLLVAVAEVIAEKALVSPEAAQNLVLEAFHGRIPDPVLNDLVHEVGDMAAHQATATEITEHIVRVVNHNL